MRKSLFILPFLSALFYVFASPPLDLYPLGWIVLLPLLYAVLGSSGTKEAFYLGLTGGLFASAGLYYWLIYTMTSYGGVPLALSLLIFLPLAAYLALYWAIFAFIVRRFSHKPPLVTILGASFLWVALEYLRTYLFSGFPWALLGYTQASFPLAIQVSDITGVYGVSFFLALFSAAFASGLRQYMKENLLPLPELLCITVSLILPLAYGFVKIQNYEESERTLSVALVQGNIEQSIKWEEGQRDATIEIYKGLSREARAVAGNLDLIVWPETAAPFYFQQPGRLREELLHLTLELESTLLFGSPGYKLKGEKVSYLNSAFLAGPSGPGEAKTFGRYDKLHLVPFGEYVPLGKLLFFVSKITEGIGDFSPGEGVMTLDLPKRFTAGRQVRLGTLICYEGIFPGLVRQFVKNGANVLVNITNDAWYGRSSAPYQHLSAALFRSVENGVYMLRAANTGISAIIDPLGRVEQSKPLFERGYVAGRVGLPEKLTFYTKYGDLFAMIASFFSVLIIFYMQLWRRK